MASEVTGWRAWARVVTAGALVLLAVTFSLRGGEGVLTITNNTDIPLESLWVEGVDVGPLGPGETTTAVNVGTMYESLSWEARSGDSTFGAQVVDRDGSVKLGGGWHRFEFIEVQRNDGSPGFILQR